MIAFRTSFVNLFSEAIRSVFLPVRHLRQAMIYLMPDETALRELSEGVIEKLKLLTDAEFAELEFPPD